MILNVFLDFVDFGFGLKFYSVFYSYFLFSDFWMRFPESTARGAAGRTGGSIVALPGRNDFELHSAK